MKKILLLITLSCLLVNVSIAHPLIPKDHYAILINYLHSTSLVSITIPVYLNTLKNTNIKYCWYATSEMFGEKVRTSEEPIRTEEGTYESGRLTMYHKDSYFYKFEWSNNGAIKQITKYDNNGKFIEAMSPSSSLIWYEANTTIRLAMDKISIHNTVPFLLKSYETYKTGGFNVRGYTIKDDHVVEINFWGYKDGKIERDETRRCHILEIWEPYNGRMFKFYDPVECDYIES